MTSKTGKKTLTSYAYTYYASGNRQSETDKSRAVTTYVYDDLGRLTKESETGGLTVKYTYNSAGNRTKMAVTGTETYTTTYTYDKNNRLTQEKKTAGSTAATTVYAYDANGNLLQKSDPDGAELYEYNGFNQLTVLKQGGTATTYAYNASGIRTAKRTANGGTYYLLDGGDVVGECADGMLTAIYARGINLISRKSGGMTKFYVQDAHGDVVCVTENTGVPIRYYAYDAFGNEKNPDSTDTNPFRYCGEYFDKETKTYYLRARYYDPAIGRFTQQDTHWSPANSIYGDNPRKIHERQDALGLTTYAYAPEITAIMQSGNLYVYCVNNPVTYRDSTGSVTELIIFGIPIALESIFAALGLTATTAFLIFSDFRKDFSEAVQYTLESIESAIYDVGVATETLSIEYVRPQLPSWKKVKIDMEHIMSGHSFGGKRGGPNKSRFPQWMTAPMIEKAIREAYQTAEKIGALQCSWQNGVWTIRQLFQGTSNGMDIQFWFNYITNTIETGWPV